MNTKGVKKVVYWKKVERAKSILMKRCQIAESEAYRMIQKQSMDKSRSLKEIAEAIIVSEDLAEERKNKTGR